MSDWTPPRVTFERQVETKEGLRFRCEIQAVMHGVWGAHHGLEAFADVRIVKALALVDPAADGAQFIGRDIMRDLHHETVERLRSAAEAEYRLDCSDPLPEEIGKRRANELRGIARPSIVVASTEGEIA